MNKLISHFIKIVAIWVIGFIVFFSTLPETPKEIPDPADAIVVLTGDSYRISAGFHLYKNYRGEKLLISGVYPGTTVMDLARPYLSAAQMVGIDLDDKATNTRENAIETAKWMRKNKFRSLILVTSNYHMRRAWIHFQNHIPGVVITGYPVVSDQDSPTHWSKSYKGIRNMVRAYNKLIVTFPLLILHKFT